MRSAASSLTAACTAGATAASSACTHKLAGSTSGAARRALRRHASTFSYLKPGPAPKLVHELVFDESERYANWKSDTIPWVAPPRPPQEPLHARQARYDGYVALLKQDPWTFLVRATLGGVGGTDQQPLPLTDEEAAPYLAPPSDAEKAAVATPAGRMAMAEAVQKQIKEVVDLLRAAEAQALDAGAGASASTPYTQEQREALARAAHVTAAKAGVKVLRQLSILHAAHIAALPREEQPAAQKAWLEAVGINDPLAPGARAAAERSPRVPLDLWLTQDDPMHSPMTPTEVRDGPNYLDYDAQKLLAMEHRDRTEVGSRTALPPSLAAGAPSEDLANAARALESNPSLTQQDREYMLQFYADALADKPAAWDVSKEKAAFMDPQPQWSVYDPALARLQDDARDALYGRGRFSSYRGSQATAEMTPPSLTGEGPIYGVGSKQHGDLSGAGTPPETVEEAAAIAEDVAGRLAAESAMASAAVTAALERSMGLKPRKQAGAGVPLPSVVSSPAFWARYKAGQRVEGSDPVPPVKGREFKEAERAPMPTDARAEGKAAGGKGGKGGAAPAGKGGAKGGAAPAAAKKK